jgi:hypothetical protein
MKQMERATMFDGPQSVYIPRLPGMTICATAGEESMPSIAKFVLGLALFVMFGLTGIRTSAATQVVLSDPLTSWPLNFGLQSDNIKLKDGAVHIIEPTNTANWATYPGFSLPTWMRASRSPRRLPRAIPAG